MRCVVLCLLLAISPAANPAPQPTKSLAPVKIHPQRVSAPPLEDSAATQFLAADTKGHPFLLRGDTLEVFGLGADAAFNRRAGQLACDRSRGPAYAAAMDPDGSMWAVGWPNEVVLCDHDKEQHPDGLRSLISSLAYSASGPLVAVTSIGPPADASEPRIQKTIPRVLGLADGRWQPVVWAPVPSFREMPANPLAEGKAQTDSLVCTAKNDATWLAYWNRYRLQKVSKDGVEREVVVGSGDVVWQGLSKKEEEHEALVRSAQGADRILLPPSGATMPRGVVRALVCGRDGYIYLVVSTPEGMALDRFNPTQNLLERVMLDGVAVSTGPMTAAFAGDELWLAGRLAADGLWKIPVEVLMAAQWQPVQDVRTTS